MTVKMLAERRNGLLLGGQIVGSEGAKRIDTIAVALWNRMTVDITGVDLSYAPFAPVGPGAGRCAQGGRSGGGRFLIQRPHQVLRQGVRLPGGEDQPSRSVGVAEDGSAGGVERVVQRRVGDAPAGQHHRVHVADRPVRPE